MRTQLEKPPVLPSRTGAPGLVAADFDNTIALTFKAPPSGVGVAEAYEIAVEETFGTSGLKAYLSQGGLQNRAPIEVVRDLVPDADADETIPMLTQLDTIKLEVLVAQITPSWPEPTDGYIQFTKALGDINSEAPGRITQGVVSSGHNPFIERVYEAWGVETPDFILGQEPIAALASAEGIAMPTKPDRQLMLYAYNLWRTLRQLDPVAEFSQGDKPHMRYVGDDPIKDGKMALDCGIAFHLLEPRRSGSIWRSILSEIIRQPETSNA